jgi:hypothetical protein
VSTWQVAIEDVRVFEFGQFRVERRDLRRVASKEFVREKGFEHYHHRHRHNINDGHGIENAFGNGEFGKISIVTLVKMLWWGYRSCRFPFACYHRWAEKAIALLLLFQLFRAHTMFFVSRERRSNR